MISSKRAFVEQQVMLTLMESSVVANTEENGMEPKYLRFGWLGFGTYHEPCGVRFSRIELFDIQ